jgi:cytochrome c oxidase assembly protein subunit 15
MSVDSTVARAKSFELSAAQFLRLALASVAALWLIVVTGAAVRLTDSGLGCRHWPGCEKGHPLPAKDYHAYIEFGNRVIGGVTIVVVLLTALAARRTPELSRGARRLALAVFLGTLAQAPLGYLAVKTDLRWPVVAAHLLLSMIVLAGAVVLALETYASVAGRAEPLVPAEVRKLGLVVAAAALALLVTGTLATAGGPHSGGGAEHVQRLWRLQPLIYVHASAVAVGLGSSSSATSPRGAGIAAPVYSAWPCWPARGPDDRGGSSIGRTSRGARPRPWDSRGGLGAARRVRHRPGDPRAVGQSP